jgi:long-chain acyl-CoA synthetase
MARTNPLRADLRGKTVFPDSAPNLVAMFFGQAAARGARPFLSHKSNGAWVSTSWAEAASRVAAMARALVALGIRPGDRVVLVSESRPEWPIADLAIMAAGGITVPAYTTNQPNDHRHILTDSGARGAIVSTAALARNLMPAALQAPSLQFLIAIDELREQQATGFAIHRWDRLLQEHAGPPAGPPPAAALDRKTTACLIYTSGTGGVPKGVMLSHGAVLHNCAGAAKLLGTLGLDDEVFLSFLPLSHSYEHTAGQFFPISIGARICYAEGVDRIAANMAEVRPTLMTAVPRLYEVMRDRILRGMRQAGGRREKLFLRAVALGRKRRETPAAMSLAERLEDRLLDVLVRRKVRQRFGGRLKAMVSGGAPLNYDVGMFFTALGVRLLQGYGQTESAPVVSVNPPRGNRIDTVGVALDGVEIRIAADGEILVRGELVMQGYWNNPAATAETIRDGWLHTGDIGVIDADGYLRITDRKKDIIVNSGGDNVSPQRVEGFLTLQPEIAQAMVYGDRRPHLVALIVPDAAFAESWAKAQSPACPAALDALVQDPAFRDAVGAAVERVNRELSVIERVRRFTLSAEPFSIENGLMTPTLKIRRHAIIARHGAALDALYS